MRVCGLHLGPRHVSMHLEACVYHCKTVSIAYAHYVNLHTLQCITTEEPHADELACRVPGLSIHELWTPSFLRGICDALIGQTSSSALANTFSVGSSTTAASVLEYQWHT